MTPAKVNKVGAATASRAALGTQLRRCRPTDAERDIAAKERRERQRHRPANQRNKLPPPHRDRLIHDEAAS